MVTFPLTSIGHLEAEPGHLHEHHQPQAAASRRSAPSVRDGFEEHWNFVMKKLAPAGYGRSPAWQRDIIERVIIKLTSRQSEVALSPLRRANTVDLGAIGLAPEAVAALQVDEERNPLPQQTIEGMRHGDFRTSSAANSSWHKALGERNNQVHYYIRAIQMEQLQQQDLNADVQQISEEISNGEKKGTQGANGANETWIRTQRQTAIIKNRCAQLANKASKTFSDNVSIRRQIDDLRHDKQESRVTLERLHAKAAKMDEDIAFLTRSAHAALDQREKVKIKFMAAQRDMLQDREQKLAVIQDLMQRETNLDNEWRLREVQLAEAEEARRQRNYADARQRRSELELAETRFGFLAHQTQGWDYEFERLQSFTRMESKFVPGQSHIVDEITSRFLEKERANASLLSFLHEQEITELIRLRDELRELQHRKAELHDLLASKTEDGSAAETDDPEFLANASAARRLQIERSLEGARQIIERIALSMWKGGHAPEQFASECSLAQMDVWLQILDARVTQVRDTSSSLLTRVDIPLAPVLTEWCAMKAPKRHVTVPEIHESLLLQVDHRNQQGADAEEEEEEEAERLREQQSKSSPFNRVRIDLHEQRQKIAAWARKRQAHRAR